MAGETHLPTLLATMRPELDPETYVFASVRDRRALPADMTALFTFEESEGTTLVLSEAEARSRGLATTFRCRRITLQVHSSLDAVGFLAAVLGTLAEAGIATNAVSAFHHDHLFVPADRWRRRWRACGGLPRARTHHDNAALIRLNCRRSPGAL